MKTEFTKGEWFANNCTVTIQGTFKEIAACHSLSEPVTEDLDEMKANAKLIAAAPELLESCLKIQSMLEAWEKSDQESFNKYMNVDAHIEIEQAIKKAIR